MAKEVIGLTKTVDKLGRIVLPNDYRKELGINENVEVELKLVLINKKNKVIEIRKKGNE